MTLPVILVVGSLTGLTLLAAGLPYEATLAAATTLILTVTTLVTRSLRRASECWSCGQRRPLERLGLCGLCADDLRPCRPERLR